MCATPKVSRCPETNGTITSTSVPTSGVKRRFFNDDCADSFGISSAQGHCGKKRRLNDHVPEAELIFSKPALNGYNAQYMAAMCYHEYATRRHEAGLQLLSENDARAFKAKLTAVLEELESGKMIHHVNQAIETIPVLARRPYAQCTTSEQLTQNFIDLYHSIQVNLHMLDMLVVGLEVNEALLGCLYELVSGIHYDFNLAAAWHDVLPYTDLSLIGLRKLRDRIIGVREYRPLIAALRSIDDIEYWLSLPPQRFEVPESMRKLAMDFMQELTEERLRSLYEPSPKIPSFEELLAKIKKEDAVKEQAYELEHFRKEQEAARRVLKAQAEEKRQQERANAIKRDLEKREAEARLAAQKKVRETKKAEAEAEAKAAAEWSAKQEKNSQAVAVIEKKLLEKKEAEAKAAAKKKMQERREAAEATRKATELEKRKFQDAHTAKEIEREQLRRKGEAKKQSVREILAYLERDDKPQNVQELYHLPSKLESLAKLTNLWTSNRGELRTVLPLPLLANQDRLLELESSVMTEALNAFAILKARSCDPSKVFATGWDSKVLNRLQRLLIPYDNNSPLSGLKDVVDAICKLLADFKIASQTTTDANIDSSASRSTSNIFVGQAKATPPGQEFLSPYNQASESHTIKTAPQPHASDVDMLDDTQSHESRDTNKKLVFRKIRNPLPCKFATNGTCSRGEEYNYTHPWDVSLEALWEAPCYHFFRAGFCRNGDKCHLSHDTARFGPPHVTKQPRQSPQIQKRIGWDTSLDNLLNESHSASTSCDTRSHPRKKSTEPQRAPKPPSILESLDKINGTNDKTSTSNVSRSHNAKALQLQHIQKSASLYKSLEEITGAHHKASVPHDARSQKPCRYDSNCTRKNCAFKHDSAANTSKSPFAPIRNLSNPRFYPTVDSGNGSVKPEHVQWCGGPTSNQGFGYGFNYATWSNI